MTKQKSPQKHAKCQMCNILMLCEIQMCLRNEELIRGNIYLQL